MVQFCRSILNFCIKLRSIVQKPYVHFTQRLGVCYTNLGSILKRLKFVSQKARVYFTIQLRFILHKVLHACRKSFYAQLWHYQTWSYGAYILKPLSFYAFRGQRYIFARVNHRNLHRCRKYNTYQLLTLISKQRHINFYDLLVQKYTFDPETHKMTMVLENELYNFMLKTARIGHENTYDMRGNLDILILELK